MWRVSKPLDPTRFGRDGRRRRFERAGTSGDGCRARGQADVSLGYLLRAGRQGWRIINIVADGVSDLALKRAEYQRVFASGGIDGLVAELEQQTQRLAPQLTRPRG